MATNFIQNGKTVTYSNTGSAISSGDPVVLGNSIGVALTDIAATTGTGAVQVEGVFSLAAETDAAFSVGDQLFWDTSAEELTKTANANTVSAGTCWEAKGSSAATGKVKLSGGAADVPRAATVAALTDSSGGATADGTIGAITAPTALTDNSGGATADGTIGAVTAPTALTDNSGGATADGTIADIASADASETCDRSVIADAVTELATGQNVARTAIVALTDAVTEITTIQGVNRTAIIALKDAVAELATKQNAVIAALKAANLMDQ